MTTDKKDRIPNAPDLRFPEFRGEWKVSTIGDCFELYSGNTPSRLDKENFIGDVNWITSGELKEHYIGDTKEHISEDVAKENNLKLVPVGTFVIAIYGLEAEGIRGTGSITTKKSTISQACMAFTPKGEITNEFLYSWYKKHGNVIGTKYAQGTKQQNLSYDIIEKFKIHFPTVQEQDKLNRFISLLDERISTQSRAIEKLQSLMSAIVEMALCKQVLRFPPFITSWKKTKLGELGYFIRGLSYDNNLVVDDDSQTLVVRSNNINSGKEINLDSDVVFVSKSPDDEQILRKDDIVFCMANGSSVLVGKNSYYNGGYNGTITIGIFCGIYRGQSKLTRWILCSSEYQRAIFNLMQGGNGAIANLKGNDILNLSFKYPTENEEESKLVSLLSAIDTKIRNEEQLLKYYQTQKQHLLKQMFI